jgi:thiamine pyrophosphate-dependent acetolactate synthase large subunit-like protein
VLRAHHAAQRCDVLLVVGLEVADDLVVSLLEAAKSPSTVVVQVGPSAGKRTRWLMDVVLEGPIDDVLTRLDAALPREPD